MKKLFLKDFVKGDKMNENVKMKNPIEQFLEFMKYEMYHDQDTGTEWKRVFTGFYGLHNDGIEFYYKQTQKSFTISDDGETLKELRMIGVNTNNKKSDDYKKILSTLNNLGGFKIIKGEITLKVEKNKTAETILRYINVIIQLHNFYGC